MTMKTGIMKLPSKRDSQCVKVSGISTIRLTVFHDMNVPDANNDVDCTGEKDLRNIMSQTETCYEKRKEEHDNFYCKTEAGMEVNSNEVQQLQNDSDNQAREHLGPDISTGDEKSTLGNQVCENVKGLLLL